MQGLGQNVAMTIAYRSDNNELRSKQVNICLIVKRLERSLTSVTSIGSIALLVHGLIYSSSSTSSSDATVHSAESARRLPRLWLRYPTTAAYPTGASAAWTPRRALIDHLRPVGVELLLARPLLFPIDAPL